jgi:hypothetical protein
MMRLLLAFLAVIALAGGAAGGGLGPAVPAATGDPHPEGAEYWRLHHMDMLQHDRDLVLRDGMRDVQASIGTCFDCHAVKDEAGNDVTAEDPRHFCRVCHDYAAVEVDCFMCHRSTPDEDKAYRSMAQSTDPNSITAYLARVAKEMSDE